MWEVLKTMCEKLVTVHSQFVKMLAELSREIGDYHHTQKEKFKNSVSPSICSVRLCVYLFVCSTDCDSECSCDKLYCMCVCVCYGVCILTIFNVYS